MSTEPPIPPREAVATVRLRAPTRGNRRLQRLLEAADGDLQLKAWWHASAVNASRRLGMSDHSWVHIQIVLNIGLRLARLLFRLVELVQIHVDLSKPGLQLDAHRPRQILAGETVQNR